LQPGERTRRNLLLALLAVHALVSTLGVVPGYLSIDEAIYHLTTRDLVATGGFGIRTGFEVLPSQELIHPFLSLHGGRVVSPYPYLFPTLAAPLYAAIGYRGLFVLNALAFVGAVLLLHALAKRLFRDPILALDAALLFVLATFAWEYSQAAWPHALALLFVIAALLLAVVALQVSGRAGALAALGAGLVAGLAPGVRLDAVLALPCVLLVLLFARPARLRAAALAAAGAAPGLALLAWTNSLKFGAPNPLSYGNPFGALMLETYLRGAGVAAVGVAVAWALTRERARLHVARHRRALAVALVAGSAALLALPEVRKVARWTWSLAVDLRTIDADRLARWVPRTEGGGVVYLEAQKHALLQSLPWLAILLVLLLRRRDRPSGEGGALALLALVPAATLAECGLWGYDGGLCLNMRFMLPALPFLSILGVYAARELARHWGGVPHGGRLWLGAVAGGVAFLILWRDAGTPALLERPILAAPLWLAAALVALLAAGEWLTGERARRLARQGAWFALAAAVTWSGLVAFLHDYPHHWRRRAMNWSVGGEALQRVPASSLVLLSDFPDPFMRLIEGRDVLLAFPFEDGTRDFPWVLDSALAGGRKVFAVLSPEQWSSLAPVLGARCTVTPIANFAEEFWLAELRPAAGP
jgi:hypothetical protein